MKDIITKLVNGKGVFNFLMLVALNWHSFKTILEDGEISEAEKHKLEVMIAPIANDKTELYVTAICLVVAGVQLFKDAKN